MEEQLNTIEQLLSRLSESYQQTSDLLKEQIDAVVGNELESLLDAMEDLITHQETSYELEHQLREQVALLAQAVKADASTSLGDLLEQVPGNTGSIKNLRKELIANINQARTSHGQLMQLLQFAQEHTNEILRSIHVLANHHDLRYNQLGKTASTQNKTFAVNQTA